MCPETEIRNQRSELRKSEIRGQESGVRRQEANRNHTPPHSVSCGAVDENCRRKHQYSKDLRQNHPQLKCLSSGAVEQWIPAQYHTPPILWTTGQRMPRVGENAYIHGIFECLSVVQPLGQRDNG